MQLWMSISLIELFGKWKYDLCWGSWYNVVVQTTSLSFIFNLELEPPLINDFLFSVSFRLIWHTIINFIASSPFSQSKSPYSSSWSSSCACLCPWECPCYATFPCKTKKIMLFWHRDMALASFDIVGEAKIYYFNPACKVKVL